MRCHTSSFIPYHYLLLLPLLLLILQFIPSSPLLVAAHDDQSSNTDPCLYYESPAAIKNAAVLPAGATGLIVNPSFLTGDRPANLSVFAYDLQ
jgi:hypothetical protein